MKFANATNTNRKSGVAEWRDLRFPFSSHADSLHPEVRSFLPLCKNHLFWAALEAAENIDATLPLTGSSTIKN